MPGPSSCAITWMPRRSGEPSITFKRISPCFAYVTMLRASSEIAVAIRVASPGVKLNAAASERPFWRAMTMSWSDRMGTWVSCSKGFDLATQMVAAPDFRNQVNTGTRGAVAPDGCKRERRNAAASRLDEATADSVADESRGLVDVELPHQPGAVRLGGLRADPEDRRHVLRGPAFADHLQDLAFAWGERVDGNVGLAQVRLDDGAGDVRAQIDPSSPDLVDGLHEVGGRLVLQHVSLDPRAKSLADVLDLVVPGDQDGLRLRPGFLDFARGVEPVQQRHADVQDRDVRPDGGHQQEGFLAVGRLTDHLEARFLQQGPDALADERMIVCEDYAHVSPRRGRRRSAPSPGPSESGSADSPRPR